jgi:hypothetical protein
MSYQSNPAGLGVGKTYGAKAVGGVDGEVRTSGMTKQIVLQLTAGSIEDSYKSKIIHDGYLVTKLTLDVEDAFASGAAMNFSIDGGDGLTTALNLAVAGISQPALTGLTKTAGAGPVEVVFTPDAEALASAAGKAKLVIEYAIA